MQALHGNWIDLLLSLVIVSYLFAGFKRGFVLGLLDFGGFIFSFLLSLKTYKLTSILLVNNFSLPPGIANAAGFLINGFICEFFFNLLIHIFFKNILPPLLKKLRKNNIANSLIFLNKFLGIIPALGEALILSAFILTLLISLPIQGEIKKDIVSSKIGGNLVKRTQGVERQINQIFGQAVNETLSFLTINANPETSEKVNLGFTQKEIKIDEGAEIRMFDLVNEERLKNGLNKLIYSPSLRELARNYGKDMFARGYFSHYNPENQSPFDRMNQAKINYNSAGENLALAPNIDLAHQGLMNSPGHRANILSLDFVKVGIGVIDGGIYGEIFVQKFTD